MATYHLFQQRRENFRPLSNPIKDGYRAKSFSIGQIRPCRQSHHTKIQTETEIWSTGKDPDSKMTLIQCSYRSVESTLISGCRNNIESARCDQRWKGIAFSTFTDLLQRWFNVNLTSCDRCWNDVEISFMTDLASILIQLSSDSMFIEIWFILHWLNITIIVLCGGLATAV